MSTPAALSKLKVAELRERLEAQGLSTEGTKPVLLARLREGLGPGPVVKTPDVATTLTPGGRRSKRLSESSEASAAVRPETPLKRGRVSEVSEAARPASPLRRGRVSDTSRPLTPVRRSRRLSGDFPGTPVLGTAAPEAVETIAEVNEEQEEEKKVETVKVKYVSDRNLEAVETIAEVNEDEEQEPEEEKIVEVKYASDRNLKEAEKEDKKVVNKQSEIEQKLDLVKNIIADVKEEVKVEKKKEEVNSTVEKNEQPKGKENLPLPKLLEQVFSSKQIPRQKPKSGRFWKGERSQFRQIKKDKGQRLTFEQRVKMKEEKQRNQELAEMLNQRKKQAKEDQRKRMEENKEKRLENERRTEQYQIIKNPAKLKRMKKKQLRMLEKRDIMAAKK